MALAKRYFFEHGFHDEGHDSGDGTAQPTVSAADCERARAEGVSEGHAAALAGIEHSTLIACEAIARSLDAITEHLADTRAEAIDAGIAVAAAIVRKLFPASYRKTAEHEIRAMIASVLPGLTSADGIKVFVAPALVERVDDYLARLGGSTDGSRSVAVIADPTLADGDCRVDWGTGAAVRDGNRVWREVEALLTEMLPAAVPLLSCEERSTDRDEPATADCREVSPIVSPDGGHDA